jgi:decaprenyl-phosphate phosphoribosyltransferase
MMLTETKSATLTLEPVSSASRTWRLSDLVATARPRQWIKNVLVLAAPGAAGELIHPGVLVRSVATVGLFCVGAAGTYFVNDALDVRADRLHPTKRNRPIAAGRIPLRQAWVIGGAMLLTSIGLSGLIRPQLADVTAAYVALTLSYSLWFKTQPVLDIAVVAAGFIVRAIAGGVATGVPLSHWFLIVTSFAALLMVSGKRHAEHVVLGEDAGDHRATLSQYSLAYLRYLRSLSSSVAIAGYCLWAFEKAHTAGHAGLWFELSVAPFVVAILRYSLILDQGGGGAPEDVVLADRPLQLMGLAWLVFFGIGLYAY